MSIVTGKEPIVLARHKAGIVEFIRAGAYANLNDIAAPFGKRVDNWKRLDQSKAVIQEFNQEPCYSGYQPIISVVGRNLAHSDLRMLNALGVQNPKQGTWAHPDIAIQFAQWASPGFALWVSRQIRYLLTYGEVNLHYTEWSDDEYLQGVEYNREDIRDMYGR